jgi:hypothetical protein
VSASAQTKSRVVMNRLPKIEFLPNGRVPRRLTAPVEAAGGAE